MSLCGIGEIQLKQIATLRSFRSRFFSIHFAGLRYIWMLIQRLSAKSLSEQYNSCQKLEKFRVMLKWNFSRFFRSGIDFSFCNRPQLALYCVSQSLTRAKGGFAWQTETSSRFGIWQTSKHVVSLRIEKTAIFGNFVDCSKYQRHSRNRKLIRLDANISSRRIRLTGFFPGWLSSHCRSFGPIHMESKCINCDIEPWTIHYELKFLVRFKSHIVTRFDTTRVWENGQILLWTVAFGLFDDGKIQQCWFFFKIFPFTSSRSTRRHCWNTKI